MHKKIKMSFVRIRHSDVPIGRIRQVFSKAAISNLAMIFLLLSLGSSCDLPSSAPQTPAKGMESTRQEETSDVVSNVGTVQAQVRKVRMIYEVAIEEVPQGEALRIWIPRIKSDPFQDVKLISVQIPGDIQDGRETRYGNRYWFTEVADINPTIRVEIIYDIERREVVPENYAAVASGDQDLFLQPNHLVPVGGESIEALLDEKPIPAPAHEKAEVFYDLVLEHVDYKKPEGEPWGRGDTNWVCDSRYGNCTDFHSLFISLCRTHRVPAKFEIGFPLGPGPAANLPGYHCWAYYAAEREWYPVDISEADKNMDQRSYFFGKLTADRIAVTQGRDLHLTPAPAAGPLNYWIDPWVEIDGRPHPHLKKRYRYERIPESKDPN